MLLCSTAAAPDWIRLRNHRSQWARAFWHPNSALISCLVPAPSKVGPKCCELCSEAQKPFALQLPATRSPRRERERAKELIDFKNCENSHCVFVFVCERLFICFHSFRFPSLAAPSSSAENSNGLPGSQPALNQSRLDHGIVQLRQRFSALAFCLPTRRT